jgi:hypothetical protein
MMFPMKWTRQLREAKMSDNSEANNGTPNDSNDMNGILHNSVEPTVQNIENNEIVSSNTLGHSDRFACKYRNIIDEKWGMIKSYHADVGGGLK